MDRQYALSAVLLLASLQILFAFAPVGQLQRSPVSPSSSSVRVFGLRSQLTASTRLWMAEEQEKQEEETEPADSDSAEDSDEESQEEVEKEEEPAEDTEIVDLKEEIAQLESTLKSKKTMLSYAQDQVEEYSKPGYARKVAEMENMRRVRSNMNSSGRSSATAGVLADFLPVYDKLNQLKEKYANNDFGSKYGGLSMDATFAKMGVKEYAVAAGETVDNFRMAVGESEYSAEFAKDTVIRPVAGGMELEGNVIRAAECVASLGAEEKAQEDEEDSQKDETEETDSE